MKNNVFITHPGCIESRVKLRGLLSDIYPGERIKINLILNAYDEGIVESIQREKELTTVAFGRWKKVLIETYGISENNAEWAVDYWFTEYGVGSLGKNYRKNKLAEPNTSTARTTPKKSTAKKSIPGILRLEDMDNGEKIPKSMMEIILTREATAFIASMNCVVRKTSAWHDEETCLKVAGEYAGTTNEHLLIMVMVYNAENTLIGYCCRTQIRKGFDGEAAFEDMIFVPSDEQISKIVVRTARQPFY